MQSYKLK